jgi:hypothetical protein
MTEWTTPDDIVGRLRRRWDRGEFLRARAHHAPFEVLDLPIRGPKVGELGERFDDVGAWVRLWHNARRQHPLTVIDKTVGGRRFGVTTLPARVRVDDLADLSRLLGTTRQIATHDRLLESAAWAPRVRDWVADKPHRALAHADDFAALMVALRWIVDNAGSGRRLREIDAPGIDTKFIESHHRILLELGALVVESDLMRPTEPGIAGRFGFATADTRIRFRMLDHDIDSPIAGFDDVEVRAVDLARTPLRVSTVYIVENLATYLSFPDVPDAAVLFGGGYAAVAIGALTWLRDKRIRYWGDLDTHGFAILDRVRVTIGHAESFLMDSDTLLAHRRSWGTEPHQVTRSLPRLTDAEAQTYQALVEATFGPSIRLEQERIPMAQAREVLGLDG